MTIRYKLTNGNMQTFARTQWAMNEWKGTAGVGPICTNAWLHCYSDPVLAAFLYTKHVAYFKIRLFECEVAGNHVEDQGTKEGWQKMRLTKELKLKKPTRTQCIKFAILCSLEVYKNRKFAKWARNWLNGTDRTIKSARMIHDGSHPWYTLHAVWAADYKVFAPDYQAAGAALDLACHTDGKADLIKIAKKAMEK
jgi:hypothetical protein